MPHVSGYALKSKLATLLRRMADRLAPLPATSLSATYFVKFTGSGDGVIRYPTTTSAPAQIMADQRFEPGEGWSPA